MRIREEGYVDPRGLLRLAVEPEARDDSLHGGLDLAWWSLRLLRHVSVAPCGFAGRQTARRILNLSSNQFPLRPLRLTGLPELRGGAGKKNFSPIWLPGAASPPRLPARGFTTALFLFRQGG